MNKELDFELYLSLSFTEYSIYLLDTKNLKNLYEENFKLKEEQKFIDYNILNQFLENNIFKIEKLIGKFIKNISLIVETDQIINTEIGVKKKNYEKTISQKQIENSLFELKDLFNENYPNNKIIHLIIKNYLVNDINYTSYKDNLISDNFCLEVQVISISSKLTLEIEKIIQKYHIKPNQYLDRKYIKKFCNESANDLSIIAYKVQNGFNVNEIELIPKKYKKLGFFEKFFQLFS